jgi:hypothetical protein
VEDFPGWVRSRAVDPVSDSLEVLKVQVGLVEGLLAPFLYLDGLEGWLVDLSLLGCFPLTPLWNSPVRLLRLVVLDGLLLPWSRFGVLVFFLFRGLPPPFV